jgi:hypothetical protein
LAFREEEIKTYKTIIICDDCKKESILIEIKSPTSFDTRMNGAISKGFTFNTYDGNEFKNYCKECKTKYN